MGIEQLRQTYHRRICEHTLAAPGGVLNIADQESKISKKIAKNLVRRLNYPLAPQPPPGQRAGTLFEQITGEFLEQAFKLLHHLRPGRWRFSVKQSISGFEEYEHLANIQQALKAYLDLTAALGGDYLVMPDILISRYPVSDDEINRLTPVVDQAISTARLTPLRAVNHPTPSLILHASISCKWTIGKDKGQNIRTEMLNLIREPEDHPTYIAAVTAEPMPTRLASLALGTGDLNCTYHFALPELQAAVAETGSESQLEMLQGIIDGRRLRDISDLPFDLAT